MEIIFLAVMNSSSSDPVTPFIRLFVCAFVRPFFRSSKMFFQGLSLQAYLTLPFVVNDIFINLQTLNFKRQTLTKFHFTLFGGQ